MQFCILVWNWVTYLSKIWSYKSRFQMGDQWKCSRRQTWNDSQWRIGDYKLFICFYLTFIDTQFLCWFSQLCFFFWVKKTREKCKKVPSRKSHKMIWSVRVSGRLTRVILRPCFCRVPDFRTPQFISLSAVYCFLGANQSLKVANFWISLENVVGGRTPHGR